MKRPAKRTPKLDDTQNAIRVARESVGLNQPTPEEQERAIISRVMREIGSRGGKIGGRRRAEVLSQEQRSKIAGNAARARWGKKPKAAF